MQRFLLGSAAFSGFLAVCLGAFAAHGLKTQISADAITIWQTSVQYQMYHALALLAVGLLYQQHAKVLKIAGLAFIIGSLLFSGSLYALALGAPRTLGIITPMGGTGFLVGWIALFYYAVRR